MPNGSRAPNDRPGLGVPDDEREHARAAAGRRPRPTVVAGDDRLGVALGGEACALGGQLGPQLEVVVDLAVEDDPVAAVRVGHRLVAVLDVDEGQPVEAEHRPGVPPGLVLVRAAVAHAVLGLPHRRRPWRRRPGRRRWRSRRAGHTSGAGPREWGGVQGVGTAGGVTRARRRGSSAWRCARRRRTGRARCRRATVSDRALEAPLRPQRQVDGGQEEERVQPAVRGAEHRDRARACPPKYFSGTATTNSAISRTPTTLAITR